MRIWLKGVKGIFEFPYSVLRKTRSKFSAHQFGGYPVIIVMFDFVIIILLIPFEVIKGKIQNFTQGDDGCICIGCRGFEDDRFYIGWRIFLPRNLANTAQCTCKIKN